VDLGLCGALMILIVLRLGWDITQGTRICVWHFVFNVCDLGKMYYWQQKRSRYSIRTKHLQGKNKLKLKLRRQVSSDLIWRHGIFYIKNCLVISCTIHNIQFTYQWVYSIYTICSDRELYIFF
jgi:hypothetical protein